MEDKLSALDDAMDFIKLAVNELKDYIGLEDIVNELDEIKSDLLNEYRETEEKIQEQEDINYDMKLAYAEGRL